MSGLLEGIPLGDTERSQGRTISEGEAALLHTLLWSLGPIHTDLSAAQAAGWPGLGLAGPVLAGLLTGLWVSGMAQLRRLEREHGMRLLAELGAESRYLKPVLFGETLTVESRLDAARASGSRPGQGIASFVLTGRNQAGEIVAEVKSQVVFDRVPRPS